MFTGREWAPGSLGFYEYRARAYNPTLGRFMGEDPIGFAGGLNLFNYCAGDPVNNTDPSGLAQRWYAAGHAVNRSNTAASYFADHVAYSLPPHSSTAFTVDVDALFYRGVYYNVPAYTTVIIGPDDSVVRINNLPQSASQADRHPHDPQPAETLNRSSDRLPQGHLTISAGLMTAVQEPAGMSQVFSNTGYVSIGRTQAQIDAIMRAHTNAVITGGFGSMAGIGQRPRGTGDYNNSPGSMSTGLELGGHVDMWRPRLSDTPQSQELRTGEYQFGALDSDPR